MIIHNPILTGSFTVNGTDVASITSSAASITAINSYTASQNILNGTYTLTSSFAAQTASFTAFTSSINTFTASQNITNGTFTLTSSFAAQTASFTAFTASILAQTASLNAFSASVLSYTASQNILNGTYTLTSSFAAQTASFTAFTSSVNSFTASQLVLNGTYATTGSNTFKNPQTINSNLTVTGSITAQTLIVSTINATQSYSSGSNIFGNSQANTQTFTGSMSVSGSAVFSEQLTATSPSTLFKEGFIVKATTTGGGGSQPAYTYYTAAGSKRWSSFLNVGDDKLHIANALNSEVFTIIQSGSVGIGTTTPTSSLNVVKSDNSTAAIGSFTANNLSQQTDIWYGGIRMGGTNANVDLNLASKGTGIVSITGAATFSHNVFVKADDRGYSVQAADGTYNAGLGNLNGSFLKRGYLYLNENGTTTISVVASGSSYFNGGNVGIGTTSPSYKLQVRPTTDVNMIVTNNGTNLQIGSSNDAGNAAIPINFTATSFTFNNQINQQSINQFRVASGTQSVSTTADIFRFLNEAGGINNGCYSAIFHVWVTDNNTGANAYSATYGVQTTSNGQTNAAFTVLSSVTRGTSPVSSLNLISDGGGGAAKVSLTTSGTPTAGVSYQCSAIGIF